MLAVYLLVLLLHNGNCLNIKIFQHSYGEKLIECILHITSNYFAERKVLTYVGNKQEDDKLLQAIHTTNLLSVISRRSNKKLAVPHEAYIISGKNATYFSSRFVNIIKETTWNPEARFLIIVREVKESEINVILDTCLTLHANNVVIVNATEDAQLYTYNPFDNYGCGKRYDNHINYGKCVDAYSINIYPNKVITGLRNCTFNVLLTQMPPYTIITTNDSDNSSPLRHGTEPYLFKLIGEMQEFKINIINDYGVVEEFPTVSTDMEAVGSLKQVQDNEADAVLGGMLLTPSRAVAFSYISGHLAYTDDIRFVVKRASFVPAWKNVYLEFSASVWVLLILALIFYSILIIILLQTEDKSDVVLMLLDNLVLHGRNIQFRWAVKCVLILWVWFAYLVNTFYQSSLVSLTTNPAQEYQISNEEDIAKYQLKPCFSSIMGKYNLESEQSDDDYKKVDGCSGLLESVKTVIKSKDSYTIFLYGLYRYNQQEFYDEYGNSLVITLPKPYSKVIYSIYLYKGFPLMHKISQKSLLLRENGLADKVMNDMYYLKQIKHRFRVKEFRGRFSIPWRVYIFGCSISVITFAVEVLSKYN